jgi:uncharacterized protein (TIGR02453 family)
MASPKTPHFTPRLFRFLKDLKRHNDRDWFKANQPRYERDVRDPLIAFVADVAPRLETISPQIVADPRKSGGSMFRIHRDVRFSADKSPYKTHAAAQFRHAEGKDVHAPGYYLHLEPGSVFMAAGMWRPDSASLANIRHAIAADPKAWKRVTTAKALASTFTREGESLKRPPRGFDAAHPLVEDLKRKDHVLVARFDESQACEAGFLSAFVQRCRSASRFMSFLASANDLPW